MRDSSDKEQDASQGGCCDDEFVEDHACELIESYSLRSEYFKTGADEYIGRRTPCWHESDRCRRGEAGEDGASCGAAA